MSFNLKSDLFQDPTVNENLQLYNLLCEPSVQLRMIKRRDNFSQVTSTSNFEPEFDYMMEKLLTKKQPESIQEIFIIHPTVKSVNIYKMLYNMITIPGSGVPNNWSGYNVEYLQRIDYIDIRTFCRYLWYDQFLNAKTFVKTEICKNKFEQYVNNSISQLCSAIDPNDIIIRDRLIEHIKITFCS